MFEILEYYDLDKSGLQNKIEKVLSKIKEGEFKSAQIKKLTGTEYYRAKLDDSNRLLFKISSHKDKAYLLLLETIRNHNYSRSRFLNGASVLEKSILEEKWEDAHSPQNTEELSLRFVNTKHSQFHYLDKPISFDEFQSELFSSSLPLIVVGSAGSGKTAIMLEKMKQFEGRILYVTLSQFLSESARNLYFSYGYQNEKQEIDFFSYNELVESIFVPEGKECSYDKFKNWYLKQKSPFSSKLSRKVFEEFKGVLTGTSFDKPYLSKEEYLGLGIKQSIFLGEERVDIYSLFERYLSFLKQENLFDINIESYQVLNNISPSYNYICVDEIQDLTTIQITLILKFLQDKDNFLLCGDSNQIVHPNFFSWSKVKSFFFKNELSPNELIKVLQHNYRNAISVNNLANNLLKIKQKRFGSIDKESNYLVQSDSSYNGIIDFYKDMASIRKDLNEKTRRSTKFAIITLNEEQKEIAKSVFNTPLVFTVYEAKGLEYPNIILFNMVSEAQNEFKEICSNVEKQDLESTHMQYIRAKDKYDKSVEGLKFYINSLYVAVTRATDGIYWIESATQQPLFSLIGLKEVKEKITLKEEQSSIDEWQKEARKLELQGKQEQANDIRKNVLKQIPVPWKITTMGDVEKLLRNDLKTFAFDKKAQRFLFEMAYAYQWKFLMPMLIEAKYSLATNHNEARSYIYNKFYSNLKKANLNQLKELIFKHGVEFQNPLGEQSYSIAAKLEEIDILRELISWGAAKDSFDLSGRTPFGKLLYAFLNKSLIKEDQFEELFRILSPSSISLKYKNRLIKIDQKSPEFMFIQILLTLLTDFIFKEEIVGSKIYFNSEILTKIVEKFPDFIFPEWRKKRSYISSILSKNEIEKINISGKASAESKRIFVRLRTGLYILNPSLEILSGNQWIGILSLFPYEIFSSTLKFSDVSNSIHFMKDLRNKIELKNSTISSDKS